MKKQILSVFLMFLLITSSAYAHSGRTDSKGGHKDNKNASGLGSYHYHHGYGAHLHPNGVCPYDNENTTVPATEKAQPIEAAIPVAEESHPMETTSQNSQAIKVFVEGTEILFDQPPELINGRVMVPLRPVAEMMGCAVEWDPITQTVYVNNETIPLDKTAAFSDSINIYVNNEPVGSLDQPPVNINGRILSPIRFVAEKLGYDTQWNPDALIVTINKK